MRVRNTVFVMMLILVLCCSCGNQQGSASFQKESAISETGKEEELTILFIHDLHSYLDEKETEEGEQEYGIARLKTKIDEIKEEKNNVAVFDAGDFSMGTLYQTLYQTESTEYVSLGKLGVEATCIGNHEFDYGAGGVANMIKAGQRKAQEEQVTLPPILCANVDWTKNTTEDNIQVKQALDRQGDTRYTIIEKNGIRIGVFGIFGKNADSCSPNSGFVFEDPIASAKEIVKELKSQNVDMIVCLSHSGTADQYKSSEDELLAKEVPDIDVIVSAHTHTELNEPIVSDNTYIVSSGSYGEHLGEITLQKEGERWQCAQYLLIPMDESVAQNEEIEQFLLTEHALINTQYLNQYGYHSGQVIAYNDNMLTMPNGEDTVPKENNLAELIADSYIYTLEKNETFDHDIKTIAIVASGIVRSDLPKGEVTVDDAFEVCSLGIGPDDIPGYPLVSMYLTGKEVKQIAEVDASITPLMPAAQLYSSGMQWSINLKRPFLNKVFDVCYISDTGERMEIKDDELYRIVGSSYAAQMMQEVENNSLGLLKFQLKDQDGNPAEHINDYILYNEEKQEIKEWMALADYLKSFPQKDGVSCITDEYAQPLQRKIVYQDYNIVQLLEKPNRFRFLYLAVLVILIVVFVLLVKGMRRVIIRFLKKK